MIELTVPAEYRNFDAGAARIHLLDYGDTLLRAFSDEAHGYVAKVLQERKVELNLGTGVKEVGTGHALLSDGTVIPTRCVVWGGGITGAAGRRRRRLHGRPGRARRRPGRPDPRGQPRGLRGRGHRQHPRPGG